VRSTRQYKLVGDTSNIIFKCRYASEQVAIIRVEGGDGTDRIVTREDFGLYEEHIPPNWKYFLISPDGSSSSAMMRRISDLADYRMRYNRMAWRAFRVALVNGVIVAEDVDAAASGDDGDDI
jgi:hypothetical protein